MFQHTKSTIEGPGFKYSHEYRAEAVGLPLREFHTFRTGSEEIDIQNYVQLEAFLREKCVEHVRLSVGTNTLIALRGNTGKMVLFQFDQMLKMSIRHLGTLAFKKAIKENIDTDKAAIMKTYRTELEKKDAELARVLSLVTRKVAV